MLNKYTFFLIKETVMNLSHILPSWLSFSQLEKESEQDLSTRAALESVVDKIATIILKDCPAYPAEKVGQLENDVNIMAEGFNGNAMRIAKKLPLFEKAIASNREKVCSQIAEVIKLRHEKETAPELRRDPDHWLARKIAKGMLAIELGVAVENIGKGVNQSVYIKSISGKILGVFKPQNPRPLRQRVLQLLGQGQRQFLNDGFYAETCAEKAADIIARKLDDRDLASKVSNKGLSVCPVKIIKMLEERNEGAFLIFAKGSSANEMQINNKAIDVEEKDLFQKFFIYDFLLGNLDRHSENWLTRGDEEGAVKQIIPIDNANSLPRHDINIKNFNAWKSRYAWNRLKIAQEPFSNDVKEFIRTHMAKDQIDAMIKAINSDADISRLYENEAIVHIKKNWHSASIQEIALRINGGEALQQDQQDDIIKKMLKDESFATINPSKFFSLQSEKGLRNRAKVLLSIANGAIETPFELSKIWNGKSVAQRLLQDKAPLLDKSILDESICEPSVGTEDWIVLE